ncbi:MAG: aminomethyl-transferring glycine dehydrogenase subunit GcvPA, partial [Verrucomicrobiales bacterium]|nr:aminomethyl-transferring glycine dehydrogenase subunit GcvPA [Verrucomicrobiales bacterium]
MSSGKDLSGSTDLFAPADRFSRRHIGPNAADTAEMLRVIGFDSLDALVDAAIPANIRLRAPLRLPPARTEFEALRDLKAIAAHNQVFRSFIGMGFYDCITPAVIQRNVLENPGWYTQYTPYQAEISQGRLEALLNFQTMVSDLTALDVANASLLDEATACAEAMMMAHRLKGAEGRNRFFVSETCHPQNIAVVQTRARALGIEVVVGDAASFALDEQFFGALVQYPDTFGAIADHAPLVERAHAAGALVAVATDLLALTLLKPPGEFGADIAVGSAQRFGVPMGYGGPHAAFFATRDDFKRQMPGRLVGVSRDARGRPALRLALQTREQHIRREKATSNICTAQALLASMAALYAVYHGPDGLKRIARRVHALTELLAAGLEQLGCRVGPALRFDTLRVEPRSGRADEIVRIAAAHRMNFRVIDERTVGISLDETTGVADVEEIWQVFNGDRRPAFNAESLAPAVRSPFLATDGGASASAVSGAAAASWVRRSAFLTHPVFNRYHSETEMLRYLKRLESRDLSLCQSMIPLGSCTMKLNAAAEL